MTDQKRLDPRLIILTLVCILYIFIKLTLNTYCITYQIAQCPDNLNLDSYSIEATTDEEATEKVKEILNNNNLNSDDYIITVKDNFIIVEAGQTEETQAETSEETEILIETPKGGINVLIDYTANKKYTTTDGEEIYLSEEIINSGYKYLYIYKSTNTSGYQYYFFNDYEITKYNTSGNPTKILLKEALGIINGGGTLITQILKEGANLSCTVYEEKEIVIYGVNILNFNIYKEDGTIYKEANINITPETEEPETPTDPEEPTEPETNTDYTEQIKEVNANLQKIQEINTSILIMFGILFIYMFTSSMFRGK